MAPTGPDEVGEQRTTPSASSASSGSSADGEPRGGVLDRLVDDLAVVLLDGGSEGDGEELTFPVAVLPDEAAEGSWLRLWLSDGVVTAVETDAERTGATRERVQRKLERIRTRQGGGRFGR